MVTTATVEAFSVGEAIDKVDGVHKAFGNDVEIDLKILAGDNADDRAERLGYAFTWLKNKSLEGTTMAEKTGAIEINIITDMTKLPQKIASAAAAIKNDTELTGASYNPIAFVGTQPVRGINYWFFAEQTRMTNPLVKNIVKLAVNEFQGKFEVAKKTIKVINFTE